MTVNAINILNAGNFHISFPSPNNEILLKTETDWTDPTVNSTNGTITYSVARNTANIKFNNGSDIYVVNHNFNSPLCVANDTLKFIVSGTTTHPDDQFDVVVTVDLQGATASNIISVVII